MDRAGSGNPGLRGHLLDFEAGYVFTLWSATRGATAAFIKAPRPAAFGWRGVLLDLSGHVSDGNMRGDAYIDVGGRFGDLPFGATQLSQTTIGGKAKLSAVYTMPGMAVIPHVSFAYDHAVRQSHTLDVPGGTTPGVGPGLITFDLARGVERYQAGVEVLASGGLGASAAITHSRSDDARSTGVRGTAHWRF